MLKNFKNYLKFFIKVKIVASLRSVFLALFGASVNKKEWRRRILIINLDAIGDIVAFTSVLKHYPEKFPDHELYLLLSTKAHLPESAFGYKYKLIYLNPDKFKKNPFYGFKLINLLRKIGFSTVVEHNPSIGEILGKMIAVEIKAEKTIGYEGFGIQLLKPYDLNMKKGIKYVQKKLFPKFTKIIPRIDKNIDLGKRLPHMIRHYAAIYEAVTGSRESDYSPRIFISPGADKSVNEMLLSNNLIPLSYAVLTLGTTTPHREWGATKFAEAAKIIKENEIPVVLVGAKGEIKLGNEFEKLYKGRIVNLIGKTSLEEFFAIIKNSLLSFSNDTASVHIAVALGKPSIAVLGLGHFGMLSLYGYKDINHWVWSDEKCLCDNWRCTFTVKPGEPTLCVAAVKVEDVSRKLAALVDYLKTSKTYPQTDFQIEFDDV